MNIDKGHKTLFNLLKELRVNAGLRQVDLAKKLRVPQSMISKYEVGERRLDLLEVREICSVLEISLVDFIKQLETQLSLAQHETDTKISK
ncbi:helix-turn-helix domain-containing protein [Nereida ignava]|uniref:helix-turn-helix domain-containing protein n=1 Tax=Nereida ignava TaxID=282199 RepID=UPI002FE24105